MGDLPCGARRLLVVALISLLGLQLALQLRSALILAPDGRVNVHARSSAAGAALEETAGALTAAGEAERAAMEAAETRLPGIDTKVFGVPPEAVEEVATGLSEAQLKHADYQRRAPFTMINILRSEQVEAAEAIVPWEVIEPEPDRRVRVSGARVYAKNIWRFATDASERTVDGYKYLVTGGKAGKGPAVGVA